MKSQSTQQDHQAVCYLSEIPVELTSKIFSMLPSTFDVLALAATCRELRQVWVTNVVSIYRMVAPRSMPCERYAHQFLADQAGTSFDLSSICTRDVICMLKNAKVVEKAILQFEFEVVRKVNRTFVLDSLSILEKSSTCISNRKIVDGLSPEELYGLGEKGPRGHPLKFASTERPLFIRSYYQLLNLLTINPLQWQSRLEQMTLNQLHLLHETTRLTTGLGGDPAAPPPRFQDEEFGFASGWDSGKLPKHVVVRRAAWEHINLEYKRVHKKEAKPLAAYGMHEGYRCYYIGFWDHWQRVFREIACDTTYPTDLAF
ncbi:hypothetical protein G7Y89_g8778 [Cudoniella acicularis]|uniref:F-box domain-containing protein n=1 Tax=Cudoniella acicularis TaxID=354080 RepID=A0A8H4W0A0_9HELO|nr:hypothetical protein G7Y89_g8778 [Cudoniella acicularis]